MATYLVVGGAGYIGSHMVKTLVDRGETAVVLDNLSQGHERAVVTGELVVGDLGDRRVLDTVFSDHAVDCVMHFAANALVGESVADPLRYWDNNVARTATLLTAMRDHGVGRFIFSSTAAVYGEPEALPITEDASKAPTNPYGRTKLACEQMLADCETAWGLRSVCLRYFNAAGADPDGIIGEDHDPETHLIPLVLQTALGQRPEVRVFGADWDTPDGTCIRDYVHVTDLCEAHLLAAQRLLDRGPSGVFNLGCGGGHSVREVVETARQVTGRQIAAVDAPRRPGDPARLVASSALARSELGWRPRLDGLETIIETAWRWHSEHPRGYGG